MRTYLVIALLIPSMSYAQGGEFVGSVMTPQPMVSQQLTAVPTAYGTPQYLPTPTNGALRSLSVDNSSGTAEVHCAYNGGTSSHFAVPAGSVYTDNFGDRGQVMPWAVGCINPAQNTPSTGTLRFYGDR